jgi:hypothetical protein
MIGFSDNAFEFYNINEYENQITKIKYKNKMNIFGANSDEFNLD